MRGWLWSAVPIVVFALTFQSPWKRDIFSFLRMAGLLPKPRTDTTPIEPPKSLRLLSYNLFLRPPAPLFTHNVENDLKDERLELFEQKLDEYDVIALQECFGAFSMRRSWLIEAARRKGFHWHVLSPLSFGFLVDGGLLILSRLPVSRSASTVFARGKFADALAAKGAAYARIQLAGGIVLHIFTTHLQASYVQHGEAPSAEVRAKQLDELAGFVSESIRSEDFDTEKAHRVIIMGDFNVNARQKADDPQEASEEYEALRKKMGSLGRAVDVMRDSLGHFPVTCNDVLESAGGEIVPAERTLTAQTSFQRVEWTQLTLDYMWLIEPPQAGAGAAGGRLRVASASVNQMRTDAVRKGLRLTQLSDHYALEVDLAVDA